jgi:hypothetical protein
MSKVERETTIDFEYPSQMRDVGLFKAKLKLKRRTASLATEIKLAKARMLGGMAASPEDRLHFDCMATLANGVEPVPNPTPLDPTAWINELLDPAIWYAIYDRWQEYQASFSETADAAVG